MKKQSTDNILVDRYQRGSSSWFTTPSKFSKKTNIIFLTLLLAICVISLLIVQKYTKKELTVNVNGYEVINNTGITLNFSLARKDPNKKYRCILRARNYKNYEIGRRELLIPANGINNLNVRVDIPTNSTAFIADVVECSGYIPNYLQVDKKVFS